MSEKTLYQIGYDEGYAVRDYEVERLQGKIEKLERELLVIKMLYENITRFMAEGKL